MRRLWQLRQAIDERCRGFVAVGGRVIGLTISLSPLEVHVFLTPNYDTASSYAYDGRCELAVGEEG